MIELPPQFLVTRKMRLTSAMSFLISSWLPFPQSFIAVITSSTSGLENTPRWWYARTSWGANCSRRRFRGLPLCVFYCDAGWAALTATYVSPAAGGTRASSAGSDGMHSSPFQPRAGQSIEGFNGALEWMDILVRGGDGVCNKRNWPAYYKILKCDFSILLSITFRGPLF